MADLDRFIGINVTDALNELRIGRKKSHWIWYIFPQLKDLGISPVSRYYGIKDENEAREYWNNTLLSQRLITCCELLLRHDNDINEIMGSKIDAQKLQSSMTLFYKVSGNKIFERVINKFFDGELDSKTIKLLKEKSL